MLKRQIILVLFIGIACNAFSQKIRISGYVTDAGSGERLAGASIYTGSYKTGTSSNFYGYYSLIVQKGEAYVITRMVGFDPDTLKTSLHGDTIINISLNSKNNQLNEVVVTSGQSVITDIKSVGKINISTKEVEAMPRLAGEVDLVKAIQMLPGVKGGREGSSDYYVRGGGAEQNLVLLDGVPIYHSSHALGFFSVFNTDAIKNIDLIKGGFPSRYGGRLSSVLDIQLKDGNQHQLKYEVSAGLISSKILVEGPLKNENTTFLVAARRTYLDVLAALAQPKGGGTLNYHFYDLNAKLSHRFSEKDKVYLSVYSGSDKLSSEPSSTDTQNSTESNSLNWGNITSALRYNHLFGTRLFGNLTLTYTNYKFQTESEYINKQKSEDYLLAYHSKIEDAGVKFDFDYIPSNNHFIRAGTNATFHRFDPNVTRLKNYSQGQRLTDSLFNSQPTRNLEYFAYLEDEMKITERLQANIGLHFSGFLVNEKNYSSLQPRINFNYRLNGNSAFNLSYSTMTQYVHLLSNPGTGSPTDIWVPSTKNVRPQQSWQTTIGFAKNFSGNKYEFNVDGFYKRMKNVIEYALGVNFLEEGLGSSLLSEASTSWEDKVISGTGTSYGTEYFLRKKQGKLTGWIGYTLSWANRNFQAINDGATFPFKYDSRHNIAVTTAYRIKKNIEISGNWVYYTGTPTTLPLTEYKYYSEYSSSASPLKNVNVRNNFLMKDYHRLDVGVSFIKEKKKGTRSWNISVYNAYNRKNPYYVDLNQSSRNGQTKIYQYSLLPVIPSVSYNYKLK